jgi:phytoene dehydrogenase-like protein
MKAQVDAIVVGSGPNGLAAAITIAKAGRSVRVLEAAPTIGGGTRTEELTLPGFRHDVCSAIHPLALASPVLSALPLADHGLGFVQPELPLAHPLEGGRAAALHRSVEATAADLDSDGRAYRGLFDPLVREWRSVIDDLAGPPIRLPRHPLVSARFAALAVRSAVGVADSRFRGEAARALLAGSAAHAMLPLERWGTAGFGLMLQLLGHAVGWPVAVGGSSAVSDAMASVLRSLGGEIQTERPVASMRDVGPARAVLFDLSPGALARIAGDELPAGYRRALRRFRHGPGVFKVDYALSEPVPWVADDCRRAGTVHVGGTLPEIGRSAAQVAGGSHPALPYVLTAQPSLFDPTRAPAGSHTLWAYCHVPSGSRVDMTDAIERQIERFAPGFRDTVLVRHTSGPAAMEAYNPNYVDGDINGGSFDLRQLLARPVARRTPYATPNPWIFLCSSSTPPGGGVHGLCGWFAARAALQRVLR